jgi:hypothetical protein
MMASVKFMDGEIQIDATLLGKGLGIDPSAVHSHIRDGKITSRHERGEGVDAGRSRLTFFLGNRRLHFIVGKDGEIVHQSAVDFGNVPLPAVMRKPCG